jgi:hypothetical protein
MTLDGERKGLVQAKSRLSSAGGGISMVVASSWKPTEKSTTLYRECVTENGPKPISAFCEKNEIFTNKIKLSITFAPVQEYLQSFHPNFHSKILYRTSCQQGTHATS